ncbi:YHS domain-containing protein, partial [Methylibium sp.]|uniref:YHS domain-containing protein n=1 Tax=Methylibium sp. TaxID=2067992 RepID=UPI00185BD536
MHMYDHHPHGATDLQSNGRGEAPGGLSDPVCGMAVTAESVNRLEHDGKPYYFCSVRCQTRFVADPLAYIGKQGIAKGS